MKALIQRSQAASVSINNEIHNQITDGLVVLLGITQNDNKTDIEYLAEKIINLRLFKDSEKEFEKSILETGKEILLISQFTLYAVCKKGRRPDFNEAAKSDVAKPLYEEFIKALELKGAKVKTGIFGADMKVSLVNDGPVTIILESPEKNSMEQSQTN
ncbi:MAG: D-aminoacyl-tRNA deacylase [Patescibacteria group bacterium]